MAKGKNKEVQETTVATQETPVATQETQAATETPAVKENIKLVILVDKISSGKIENGIFSLAYRGKLIDRSPFKLKGANQHYGYNHHFEMADIEQIGKQFGYLETFANRENYGLGNLTIQSWGDYTKLMFALMIEDGVFNRTFETPKGTVELTVTWKGEGIVVPETMRTQPEKKEKQAKQAVDPALVEGLQLIG